MKRRAFFASLFGASTVPLVAYEKKEKQRKIDLGQKENEHIKVHTLTPGARHIITFDPNYVPLNAIRHICEISDKEGWSEDILFIAVKNKV